MKPHICFAVIALLLAILLYRSSIYSMLNGYWGYGREVKLMFDNNKATFMLTPDYWFHAKYKIKKNVLILDAECETVKAQFSIQNDKLYLVIGEETFILNRIEI